MNSLPHISVCICTYRRPELLGKLLASLRELRTDGLFTYSVVVADNDAARSAEPISQRFAAESGISLAYAVEAEQNIALARNRALSHASGTFIAFIDDDEFPDPEWLVRLVRTQEEHHCDGVLGPVRPYFESPPPAWVKRGKFFERPEYATGRIVHWSEARTGNVLFKREMLEGIPEPFRRELGTGGEDVDFFRRMTAAGRVFVWCNEAVAFELVSRTRCRRSYLLKRALLRGANFPRRGAGRLKNGLKSVVAIPCYTLLLPFLALLGQHVFLKYLIKLCDHSARVLAFAGLSVQTKREM